jgi:glycosyltransferase involved in cell wall biosynthesis
MVHANLLARIARVLVAPPVLICTIHSQNQGARWRYVAYRLTDRMTNITTAVSHQARLDSIRMGAASESRIIVVPNGVDLAVFRADSASRSRTRHDLGLADAFTWLAVGRLIEAKDFANLIDAFAQLDHGRQAMRLLIAGDGPLEEDLRDRVRRRSLDATVQFLGVRTDMPDLMRSADAYVMSSAWEGLPLTLLEAAASALPIVATDVGGNREIVIDEVSGIIAPPRSPDALAAGMRTILDLSLGERSAMGRAGYEHVRSTFDLGAVVDRWDALYREYLGRA